MNKNELAAFYGCEKTSTILARNYEKLYGWESLVLFFCGKKGDYWQVISAIYVTYGEDIHGEDEWRELNNSHVFLDRSGQLYDYDVEGYLIPYEDGDLDSKLTLSDITPENIKQYMLEEYDTFGEFYEEVMK